ncbi:uncharacterized protein N7503_008130 [Penicillium pulvis]|uniref:uncharacterized protein n=1 Tax=Penicillium pulvis TaxID=1562058 RepID=UPI002548FF9A|nr:uncharacterized protein N7503_008130 [Penicillium pulvis]KAJ5792152.1 hypothetical protein N7503_008130 [Penicillium pulvis]
MRLLSALQCQLTATVIVTSLLALASAPTAYADIWSDGGVESNLQVENIAHGAGLPFALDSFNGLEFWDDEDEESTGLDLVRRAVAITSLANNNFQSTSIKTGDIQYWYIPDDVVNGDHGTVGKGLPDYLDESGNVVSHEAAHELRKRELSKRASTTVYVSLNTCSRPSTNTTGAEGLFPQLKVYYSTSKNLKYPGPGKDDSLQNVTTASEGYIGFEIEAESDVYISVVADNSTSYSGSYNYELAISIDDYFFNVVPEDPFLYFVDSDQNAALLVTNNLTQSNSSSENFQEWMDLNPAPYTLYAHNVNDTSLSGLKSSFCAVSAHSQVVSNPSNTGMTSRGLGNKPKEQFYILGLNRSSTYIGILGMNGNSTSSGNNIVGGGGIVWQPMNFTTKTEDNCAVLFNLTFCSEVAYAVPSNPNRTVEALREIYDNYTSKYYKNFDYSLQQIQCNATADSMFSLAVNCTDCATQYKQWLCSVSIPRCADFTSNETYLQVRNAGQDFINGSSLPADDPLRWSVITNQSRNPIIDTDIKPGPYKEILPCTDICHDMVKSCPAALGFGCPTGKWLNASYGYRDPNGDITCSYLGAAYYLNFGTRLGVWGSVYMLIGMWGVWLIL